MKIKIGRTVIRTVQGDITKADFVDAIVNSAGNPSDGGSGVNNAIHKAAGPGLAAEYKKHKECKTGEAVITRAYRLPCKKVIHTKGPVWAGGNNNEIKLLADCYKNSLRIARDYPEYVGPPKNPAFELSPGIRRIAFPSISTGIHGCPLKKAAYTAAHAIYDFLTEKPHNIDEIYLVLYDHDTKDAYDKAFSMLSAELNLKERADDQIPIIGFYHEYETYGCFCNWYPAEFDYAGKHFANSEQFMMYQKVMMFGREDLAEKIMQTSDPKQCKAIAGQPFPEFISATWEATCYTIVKRGVKAKFSQNTGIRNVLLHTKDALLAECSPIDPKWGIGIALDNHDWMDVSKWKGKNYLGRILMEVREELRQEMRLAGKSYPTTHSKMYLAKPFREWESTAGVLMRIPQYYSAIHAYADTIPTSKDRDRFYNECSLYEWEIAMKINNGSGLPLAGFFEMKQEVYEIRWMLKVAQEKLEVYKV